MTPTLLQTVLRRAARLTDDPTAPGASDADLLRRFADGHDEPAFQTLLDRHGPLAWAVCRQMLPNPADAEDAFQATFLALVQSAGKLGRVKSIGGWLHGVAVKVCLKVRRTAARRKAREEKSAKPEAASPEPQWDDLHAAVHEEVERLPAVLRTVFVLCELEGVRQPDAAAKLACKLGTVSGRLTRARQALLKALTARGLAPVLAVGTVAFGSGAAAVPPVLAAKALALARGGTGIPLAVPSGVLKLAQSVTEGTMMKTKLMVAAGIAAAGLMLTGVGGWRSTADAQDQPPVRERTRPTPLPDPQPIPPTRRTEIPDEPQPPPRAPRPPALDPNGPAAPQPPIPPRPPVAPLPPRPSDPLVGPAPRGPQQRVEHMLRDAPGSKAELLDLIKEEQAAGWEFAGQVNVGRDTQLVFKRPKGNPPVDRGPRGVPGFPPGVVPAPRDRDPFNPRAEDPRPSPRAPQPRDPRRDDTLPPRRGPVPPPAEPSLPPARRSAEDLPPPFAGPLPRPSDVPSETLPVAGLPVSEPVLLSQPMPTPILERAEIHVIELKHAAPMAMSQHVKQFFAEAEVGTDEDTGTLVIRCDKQTLENIEKLVEKLDKPSKTRVPSASIPPVSR